MSSRSELISGAPPPKPHASDEEWDAWIQARREENKLLRASRSCGAPSPSHARTHGDSDKHTYDDGENQPDVPHLTPSVGPGSSASRPRTRTRPFATFQSIGSSYNSNHEASGLNPLGIDYVSLVNEHPHDFPPKYDKNGVFHASRRNASRLEGSNGNSIKSRLCSMLSRREMFHLSLYNMSHDRNATRNLFRVRSGASSSHMRGPVRNGVTRIMGTPQFLGREERSDSDVLMGWEVAEIIENPVLRAVYKRDR
jgi:hypothetical protein